MGVWRFLRVIVVPFAVLATLPAAAWAQAAEPDAALIRDIENNLIAPCCWTSPISEHQSEVADEMRAEVRAMVAQGKSRDYILSRYVDEYGERVLATPRAKGVNTLAYAAPWAALLLGALGLLLLRRRRRAPATTAAPAANAAQPEESLVRRYASVIEKELGEMDE
ncbi:MAG: cytochrome c-type biogenesis protein CcmH [Acidobacteriota bacterium]|jgi:cytochrome c-type biogenesis protein CcmH|nr:cytochrome c-type biogenesis protein CcmH [Acidobacteriota bacterium]